MPRYNLRPLRPIAPKNSYDPVGHSNDLGIDQQPLEPDHADFNIQQIPTEHTDLHSSQYFPTSSPLRPGNSILTLERNEDATVLSTVTGVRKVPVVPANNSILGFGHENLASGVVYPDCPGFSASLLPYGQFPEILQYHHDQDYWVPPPDLPEVGGWTVSSQSNVDVHQRGYIGSSPKYDFTHGQSSHSSFYKPSPALSQQLPAVQPTHNPQEKQAQKSSLHEFCIACPILWHSHFNSILSSDPQDKGISNINRSYRDLQQHIGEAHWGNYGTSCTLCDDLFFYHGAKLMDFEVAREGLADLKADLGRSFMTLRNHFKNAKVEGGGYGWGRKDYES